MSVRDVELEMALLSGQRAYHQGLSLPAAEHDAAEQYPQDDERRELFVDGWRKAYDATWLRGFQP